MLRFGIAIFALPLLLLPIVLESSNQVAAKQEDKELNADFKTSVTVHRKKSKLVAPIPSLKAARKGGPKGGGRDEVDRVERDCQEQAPVIVTWRPNRSDGIQSNRLL